MSSSVDQAFEHEYLRELFPFSIRSLWLKHATILVITPVYDNYEPCSTVF
jgi:hypothetical protein